MFISSYDEKIFNWLRTEGIVETFPYCENGVEGQANTLEDIYFKAIFSYQTFNPIEKTNKYYSANELCNIKLIQRYQKKIGAYYSTFQTDRQLTQEQVANLTHEQVKNRLNKANRVNRGIYLVTGLRGYTSTTLYEHPVIEKGKGRTEHEGCGMYRKKRLYGGLALILPETFKLFDGTTSIFEYPFILKGKEVSSNSIYEVYALAYKNPNEIELLNTRRFYSSQQKKIIKKLISLGRERNA